MLWLVVLLNILSRVIDYFSTFRLIYCQMDKLLDQTRKNLALNVISIRKKQGLSQLQLSKKAEIPRSTLTYIESGSGNPSLSNLLKITGALQISIGELISRPQLKVRHIKASNIPTLENTKIHTEVKKLLPDPIPGMEIDLLTLKPNGRFKGTPHISQTKEYFYCLEGKIIIYVDKAKYELSKGDLLAFPGDEPHAYENSSEQRKAKGFSVVTYANSFI